MTQRKSKPSKSRNMHFQSMVRHVFQTLCYQVITWGSVCRWFMALNSTNLHYSTDSWTKQCKYSIELGREGALTSCLGFWPISLNGALEHTFSWSEIQIHPSADQLSLDQVRRVLSFPPHSRAHLWTSWGLSHQQVSHKVKFLSRFVFCKSTMAAKVKSAPWYTSGKGSSLRR